MKGSTIVKVVIGTLVITAIVSSIVILSSSGPSNRNKDIASSLANFYKNRGGERTYTDKPYLKIRNMTVITSNNHNLTLDIAILSDDTKLLYQNKNLVSGSIRKVISRTSSSIYHKPRSVVNIKNSIQSDIKNNTNINTTILFENLLYSK